MVGCVCVHVYLCKYLVFSDYFSNLMNITVNNITVLICTPMTEVDHPIIYLKVKVKVKSL